MQFFFQSNNRFSTETIYDGYFMTLYNVLYTSMPVLLLSITEKPYEDNQLLRNPSLYQENAGNVRLAWKTFFGWIALSVYHAWVVYFVGYMLWLTDNIALNDLVSYGTFMIHNVVFVVTFRLWLMARCHTFIFTASILGSILAFVASTILYSNFWIFSLTMYKVYNNLLVSCEFWISNLLICVAALLPDYVIVALKTIKIQVRPTDAISVQWNRLFRGTRHSVNRNVHGNSESTYLWISDHGKSARRGIYKSAYNYILVHWIGIFELHNTFTKWTFVCVNVAVQLFFAFAQTL